jgi:integrase
VAADLDALVFTAPAGGPLRYGNFLRRVWRPAVRRAGLEGITPHVLRHTSATLLIAAGASVKDVQAHLGHADGAVTLNIYSAVLDGRAEDLAARLDTLHEQGQRTATEKPSGTGLACADDDDEDDPPASVAAMP